MMSKLNLILIQGQLCNSIIWGFYRHGSPVSHKQLNHFFLKEELMFFPASLTTYSMKMVLIKCHL